MSNNVLEKLVESLQSFKDSFYSQLTNAEKAAIIKTVIAIDSVREIEKIRIDESENV